LALTNSFFRPLAVNRPTPQSGIAISQDNAVETARFPPIWIEIAALQEEMTAVEPLDEAKSLEKLRRAAIDEFAAHGFEGANIGRIASAAGMSKKTIYRFVSSKEELFLSTAEARLNAAIYAGQTAALPGAACSERLRLSLFWFGALALSDDGIAFYRVMMRDGIRFPQIATGYADAIARGVITPLEAILRDGCEHGDIALADPNRAARMLLAMTFSEPMHDAALGVDVARDVSDIEQRIAFALRIFLNGCATRQSP
jgi:AcrR family transcriptional regulator